MELTIYQKLWKPSANCTVITIQQKNIKLLNAQPGDIIQAKITIFKKKETNGRNAQSIPTTGKIPLQQ